MNWGCFQKAAIDSSVIYPIGSAGLASSKFRQLGKCMQFQLPWDIQATALGNNHFLEHLWNTVNTLNI